MPDPLPAQDARIVAARRRARRTALLMAAIAVGVYALFLLKGVMGHG